MARSQVRATLRRQHGQGRATAVVAKVAEARARAGQARAGGAEASLLEMWQPGAPGLVGSCPIALSEKAALVNFVAEPLGSFEQGGTGVFAAWEVVDHTAKTGFRQGVAPATHLRNQQRLREALPLAA